MNSSLIYDHCCGCGICAVVCPFKCISLKFDNFGFLRPFVDKSKCKECGFCNRICPLKGENSTEKRIGKAFIGKHKDLQIINKVSSGGIGYEIANQLLKEEYIICGAAYKYQQNIVQHILCVNQDQLECINGSKYIQSYTVDAFSQIFNDKSNKFGIFGLPCQIAGLRNAIEKLHPENKEKFIFIDLFCHGIPSKLLYDLYLNEIKKISNSKNIKYINFRDKRYGEGNYLISIKFDNNFEYLSNYKNDNNIFSRFFLSNVVLQGICYSCPYRSTHSYADIRIGDYWITKKSKFQVKGYSSIIAFTSKGIEIINNLQPKCELIEVPLEEITSGQLNDKPIKIPKKRKIILKYLSLNNWKGAKRLLFIHEIIHKWKNRIKKTIKHII